MDQYRIRRDTYFGGKVKYSPEVKCWYWPWWMDLHAGDEGYAQDSFDTERKALDEIQETINYGVSTSEYLEVSVKQGSREVGGGSQEEYGTEGSGGKCS